MLHVLTLMCFVD